MSELSQSEIRELAELRYQLRKFLRHREQQLRAAGLHPQQYQLLLAVKGLPDNVRSTPGVLAERLQIRHNTVVELVDRCEMKHWLWRVENALDRREVLVFLTPQGNKTLEKGSAALRDELEQTGPALLAA